jgi:hypothetical protein
MREPSADQFFLAPGRKLLTGDSLLRPSGRRGARDMAHRLHGQHQQAAEARPSEIEANLVAEVPPVSDVAKPGRKRGSTSPWRRWRA